MVEPIIITADNLPMGEKVYLKKDYFGYRVVEPYRDPETGKINWFNLICGGKRGLFNIIVLSIILTLAYLGINELIHNYQIIASNPCDYCVGQSAKSIIPNLLSK